MVVVMFIFIFIVIILLLLKYGFVIYIMSYVLKTFHINNYYKMKRNCTAFTQTKHKF